jgi:hypothetical protein
MNTWRQLWIVSLPSRAWDVLASLQLKIYGCVILCFSLEAELMRSHQDGGKYRVTTRNAKGAIEKLINFEVEEKEEDKEDKDD